MTAIFSGIVATVVTAPPLLWILLVFVFDRFGRRTTAVKHASDWATPFFMIALIFIASELWPTHGMWVAGLFLFLFSIGLTLFLHWINPEAFLWRKAKAFIRSWFIVSVSMYFILLLVAFVDRVFL